MSSGASAEGDFKVESGESSSSLVSPGAGAALGAVSRAASTKTVSAWQSFTFAGITISKTTVRVTYEVSSGKAKKVASYSCIVNANYDIMAEVSSSKDGSWVSSGKATAECNVTVKRGAPTPWGQVTWSTASNVQFVTGSGSGAVTAHGWR